MKLPVLSSFAAAAITLGTAFSSSAATVALEYQGSDAFGTPAYQRVVDYTLDGTASRTRAGMFRLQDASDGSEILAWCIDLLHFLTLPSEYTMADWLDPTVKDNIDRLFTSVYADVDSSDEAAGFQIALWEIVSDTDGGLDLAAGSFTAAGAGAHYALAADYLDGLDTAGTGGWNLTFLNSTGDSQDLVTASQVPLPASIWLFGLALAGLNGVRRKAA